MINYPGISYLTGYNQNPDIVGRFGQGFELGRGIRAEQDAPGVFANYLDSLGGNRTVGSDMSLLDLAPSDRMVMGSHQAAQQAADPRLAQALQAKGYQPGDPARLAMQFFLSKGYQPHQAAGIVGNLMQESGLKAEARNPGDGRDGSDSIGIAQWNGPRAQALMAFAAQTGGDPNDINTQLAFIDHELRTTEGDAFSRLQAAKNPIEAAAAFVGYERPQGWTADNPYGAHGWGNRARQAAMLAKADFGGSPGTSSQMMGMQQQVQQPDTETMRAMFANPVTRPLAIEYAKSLIAQRTGKGNASFSQTPVFLTDPEGNTHAAQMSSSGGVLVNGQLLPGVPQGWKVTARPDNLRPLDLGGEFGVFDPNTGQVSGGPVKQGSPSSDMNVTMDGGIRTMAPAPGSKEAVERDRNAQQAQDRAALRATYADIVTEDIDRLISAVTDNPAFTTGIGAAATQSLPGTPAYNAKALGDTIRANVGFDRLQQMREASPTGGALGQVSNFENQLLQATLGNLELSQSQEQLLRNLERVKDIYLRIVHEGIRPGDPIADEIVGGQGGDSPPAGWTADPSLWQYLTPEEKALWQN